MHPIDLQVIRVEAVPVRLRLGVTPAERAAPQEVRISVSIILYEPPRFAARDHLMETIDYDALIRFLVEGLPQQGEIQLIETVADRVAEHAVSLSPRIARAEVRVDKPSVLQGAGMVGVTLVRHGDPKTHRHALFLAAEAAKGDVRG